MKLEGSLDAFSLPDIFQLLSFTKKSGGLRLRHAGSEGVVYFADGLVTGATADSSRQVLVRRLIGSGVVDDATLERAVQSAREGTGLVRWLLEAEVIDPDLIRQAATEQAVDAVFDLLRWGSGEFAFEVDATNPDDVGLRLATDAVVGEVTERQGAWESVSAIISGPDTLLTMPVVLGAEPTVSRDEWALLALIDGTRRVGDLVELTGCGQYAVVSTLAGLVTRGLLHVPDAEDHVTAVLRRQDLLAPLETADGESSGNRLDAPAPTEVVDGDVAARPEGETAPPGLGTAVEVPVEPAVAELPPVPPADDPHEVVEPPVELPDLADTGDEAGVEPEPADGDGSSLDSTSVDGQPLRPTRAPLLGQAHVPGNVVPTRPEPFRPQRVPDHPETAPSPRGPALQPVAAAVVGATAVATEPEAAGLIERDPSVNRSLLLRLIAGVRGL